MIGSLIIFYFVGVIFAWFREYTWCQSTLDYYYLEGGHTLTYVHDWKFINDECLWHCNKSCWISWLSLTDSIKYKGEN